VCFAGTRGLGSVSNLVLGSVATKVIHLSTVPVLLVKCRRNAICCGASSGPEPENYVKLTRVNGSPDRPADDLEVIMT